MKLIILTSSIFYLFGLKMTQNIEASQKVNPDTVHISVPANQIQINPNKTQNFILEEKKDSDLQKPASGSNQLTAPKPVHPIDKID